MPVALVGGPGNGCACNGSVWGRCPRPPCSTHWAGRAATHLQSHSRRAAAEPPRLPACRECLWCSALVILGSSATEARRSGGVPRVSRRPSGTGGCRAGTANCRLAASLTRSSPPSEKSPHWSPSGKIVRKIQDTCYFVGKSELLLTPEGKKMTPVSFKVSRRGRSGVI